MCVVMCVCVCVCVDFFLFVELILSITTQHTPFSPHTSHGYVPSQNPKGVPNLNLNNNLCVVCVVGVVGVCVIDERERESVLCVC